MIVVDASVIANAVADDDRDGELVRNRLLESGRLLAPDLLDIEVLAVLRKRWLAGTLPASRLADAVADLVVLPVERVRMLSLVMRTHELRSNVTPYDGVYVALAEALGCPLMTADRRLAQSPGIRCEIRLISRK
jgi:predicted nucleic acid-binding protein